jgi:hypothetical protein
MPEAGVGTAHYSFGPHSKKRNRAATTAAIINPSMALRTASTASIQPDGFSVSAETDVPMAAQR